MTTVDFEAELRREERAHLFTIDERDAAEDALANAYRAVIGDEPRWSNMFSYTDAVEGIREAAATGNTPGPEQPSDIGNPITPALVERMVALVRRLLKLTTDDFLGDDASDREDEEMLAEARAIVAELPDVVDGDLVEADSLVDESRWSPFGAAEVRKVALAAIRRGRQLEREGR